MGLEEEVDKGILPWFRRNAWKVALPLTFVTFVTAASCGKKKKPFESVDEEPIQDKQEVVLDVDVSNEKGEIYFENNQTGEKVPVQLQDSEDKSAIVSVPVEYLDGKDFKAFYVDTSKSHLPATFVLHPSFSHVSKPVESFSYILNLGKIVDGFFMNQLLRTKEEHDAFYSWQSEMTDRWVNWEYVKTISDSVRLELRSVECAVLDIAGTIATAKTGAKLPFDFNLSDIAKLIFKEGEDMPKRWDLYKIEHGTKTFNGKKIIFGTNSYDVIPSNIPEVEIKKIKIEDKNVTINFEARDKTIYEFLPFFRTQGFPKEDLTIKLGKTETSDLEYFYKIFRNGIIIKEDNTSNTSFVLNNLEDGKYDLELKVRDEVGNESVVEKSFFIGDVYQHSKIAFVYGRVGGTASHTDIYVMNPDGTNWVNLTNNCIGGIGDYPYARTKWEENVHPVWSPDGTKIAFTSTRDYLDGGAEIYVMYNDGTNITRLTYNLYGEDPNSKNRNRGYDGSPAWSPDGTKIAFISTRYNIVDHLCVMDADGANKKRLTPDEFWHDVVKPIWLSENKIGFYVWHNRFYTINSDGTNLEYLEGYKIDYSSKSPDGKKIVFVSSSGEEYNYHGAEIYIKNIDGTNWIRLTYSAEHRKCTQPVWSPYLD